jgi:predicted DNA-binding protein YlxM (UPF0122 family)
MEIINENISEQEVTTTILRSRAEKLRERLSLLGEQERVIMTMYLDNGNSLRQIARLTGANEANVGRRVKKIIGRLLDDKFIICIRNRKFITAFELTVARDHFVRGQTLNVIAKNNSISYHAVRRAMKNIKKIIQLNEK